jgi:uncharacterized protein (DUF305 family)
MSLKENNMKHVSFYFAAGLALAFGIAGYFVGYALTPQYAAAMYEKGGMDLGRADRLLDLRYINAMAAHHRGAMLLAEEAASKSKRSEITALTKDILTGEPKLIEELYSWKKNWYGTDRKVRDPIVAKLGEYDEKLDLRFLNALIAHHEAGIEMAGDAKKKSSRAEVLNNAEAVEAFLAKGLETLKGWRKAWYNI